ncbi:Beta-hexosaminidase [subsurface metagenome]
MNTTILKKPLSGMTLEEKIGQMFQVGFNGKKVTSDIKEMIEDYYVGGIIYFRRNIESLQQVSGLSNKLQILSARKRSGLPLLISTDQEGGMVNRLVGGTHFPGNMVLGAARKSSLAEKAGRTTAGQLRAVGINMDFAPVLDVSNNPLNLVIGTRSFGGDPLLVADLGVAFIKGMQEEGIIACAKHFPGHGDTAIDSHLDLPVIECQKERLEKVEIYPFRQAIGAGVDSIMTAHICMPALESRKGIPATLSYNILTNLLRGELGYKGVVITDCMEMKAIADSFGTVEGSVMAIEAGTDIVLVSHSLDKQKAAIEAVTGAVKEERITEERINQSVLRILRLKEKRIGLESPPVSDYRKINKKAEEEIAYEISKAGVTLVKDEDNLIPINRSNDKKVLVIDFPLKRLSMAEDDIEDNGLLVSFLRKEGIEVEHRTLFDGDSEISLPEGIGLVIVCAYGAAHNTYQVKIVKKLLANGIPLIVISSNPYDLQVFPEIPAFLTIYDYSPFNLKVASEIITGKYKANGTLPVTLKI